MVIRIVPFQIRLHASLLLKLSSSLLFQHPVPSIIVNVLLIDRINLIVVSDGGTKIESPSGRCMKVPAAWNRYFGITIFDLETPTSRVRTILIAVMF